MASLFILIVRTASFVYSVSEMGRAFKRRVVDIEIQKLSSKGNGVGSYVNPEGVESLVEVPFTIPGDKVSALLLRKRGGVYESRLESLLTSSPDRVQPLCVHFGSCGGCRWQQMAYEQQLSHKESYVRHCFAGLLTHQVNVQPITACEPPWTYRNKMEFSFSADAAGQKFLGLVLDSSRGKVFNLTECHLVNPWFVEALTAVRNWWWESDLHAYHPIRNTGSLRTLTVREGLRTGDRLLILTVSGNPDYALKQHHLEGFVAFLRAAVEPIDPEQHLSLFLCIQQATKGRATHFYEMQLYGPDHLRERLFVSPDATLPPVELLFKVSPAAFFQPNTRQAERLYSLALQLAAIPKGSVVYDLYCGTGTLGICASKAARQVVGIELSYESSLDARENAAANGCDNVAILTGSVPEVLDRIRADKSYPLPDVAMVDPPRAGLDPAALRHLLELAPLKIVYISCNPATQAANSVALLDAGYHLKAIQPLDQFPQTPHIETIALFEKSR